MASSTQQDVQLDSEYGYVKDGKVYLKKQEGQKEREIGFVKDTPEKAIEYFQNRYQFLQDKIEEIKKEVAEEEENKRSYLQKIIHFKDSLKEEKALGDYSKLEAPLNEMIEQMQEEVKANREKNRQIKEDLIQQALDNNARTDYGEASDFFKHLQQKYITTGPVGDGLDEELDKRYDEAIKSFYERRAIHNAKRQKQVEENLKRLRSMFKEFEEIKADEIITVNRKNHLLNQLKNRWKKVGFAPKRESMPMYKEINRYHNELLEIIRSEEVDALKRNAYYDLMQQYSRQQIKPVLVQEARNLFNKPLVEAYALMQDLQKIWKETGPIRERSQFQLINQFNDYCERVNTLYTLETQVRMDNPGYEEADTKEKLNMKIDVIKEQMDESQQIIDQEQDKLDNMTTDNVRLIKRQKNKLSNLRRKHKIQGLLLKKLLNQVQDMMLNR